MMRRRGFTLIEMIVAIGLLTVLLAIAGVSITGLIRIEQAARRRSESDLSLERLDRRFRRDAHRAETIVAAQPGDAGPLEFGVGANMTVRYEVEGRSIIASERLGEAVRSREEFEIIGYGPPRFERIERDGRTVAVLELPVLTDPRPDRSRLPIRIEAVVGLDAPSVMPGGS